MRKKKQRLFEELYHRYAENHSEHHHWIYFRKKVAWMIFVDGAKFFKRIMDIFLASLLLFFLSPFMLAIALIIRLQDGGPIFYTAPRVGKWGKEFLFPKFRTMQIGAHAKKEDLQKGVREKKRFKLKNDPRITPFGKFLRKSSLDELPQLWTVIKGDMSLVGPRPPLPEEVQEYSPEERLKLEVKPGITGLWQISGRSDIPFHEQVKLDVAYIKSQSLMGDFIILLKTIPAVFFGKGAY